MKKLERGKFQDGLTSANLRAGLNRASGSGDLGQRGMTSANLQSGLAKPPASPPAPSPSGSSPASGSSGSK